MLNIILISYILTVITTVLGKQTIHPNFPPSFTSFHNLNLGLLLMALEYLEYSKRVIWTTLWCFCICFEAWKTPFTALSSEFLLLFSLEERTSYWFEMRWGWNDDLMTIFFIFIPYISEKLYIVIVEVKLNWVQYNSLSMKYI